MHHICRETRTHCEADVFADVVHDSIAYVMHDVFTCTVHDSFVCLDICGTARHTHLPAGPMMRCQMLISMSHDEVSAYIVHVFAYIVHAHINESCTKHANTSCTTYENESCTA